ncbi:hypothetical protein HPHPH42_0056 [Helicobacter pylori Hp H-42]|uniref:Uncharacterized protein n=1 Tax=Helicobacter pylori Hp H-42 TaxID=992047 RepID=A0AB33XJN1_HELPX|nr:hypothetical protein HPHPH42_0056 [Helicobacter pylori Hp H-42]
MVYFKGGKRFLGWLRLKVLKRVCCRISSRPIVRIWGKSK